ncbi:MAG: hypothetical protein SFV55_00785 [Haliscomenobacter sp.]|uniref:hypothetical protein n=1 Tax=Haliscomenobacter sp. TaxID=2717303 RepID=UPI0029B23894|nr:hypothetical protein [Haliscomenobacter sp.]MDX2066922.1 hypothetical protein [Haliscomenobacter sp.]
MANNHKFRTWEWLIVVLTFLSGMAFLLKLLDSPLADLVDTPWYWLNLLVTACMFFVMMYLRVRREKQEAKHLS